MFYKGKLEVGGVFATHEGGDDEERDANGCEFDVNSIQENEGENVCEEGEASPEEEFPSKVGEAIPVDESHKIVV